MWKFNTYYYYYYFFFASWLLLLRLSEDSSQLLSGNETSESEDLRYTVSVDEPWELPLDLPGDVIDLGAIISRSSDFLYKKMQKEEYWF